MDKKQKTGVIVVTVLVAITIIGLNIGYQINARLTYSGGDFIVYEITDYSQSIYRIDILKVDESNDGAVLHIKTSSGNSGDAIGYGNFSKKGTYFDCYRLTYAYGAHFQIVGIEPMHFKWGDRVVVHYREVFQAGDQTDIWTYHGLLVKEVTITQTDSGPQTKMTILIDTNIPALTG
jgi:hypothetical protein